MAAVKILVKVTRDIGKNVPPAAIEQGKRFVFTNDLALVEYDGVAQNDQPAGTHSGVITIVRVAAANDPFFQVDNSLLFQYEATYKFNTVANTPLKKGQVTAHGVFLIDNVNNFTALELPIRFAITGGTDAYLGARGQVTEGAPANPENRLLEFDV